MTGKTNAWLAMVIVITVGFACGKLWQQSYQKSVLGSSIIAQGVSGGGEGSGGKMTTGRPKSPTSIPPQVLPTPEIMPLPGGGGEPIIIVPDDGSPSVPIYPGVDIDIDIIDSKTGKVVSQPTQPIQAVPTTMPNAPAQPNQSAQPTQPNQPIQTVPTTMPNSPDLPGESDESPSQPGQTILPDLSGLPDESPSILGDSSIARAISSFLNSTAQSLSLDTPQTIPSEESITLYLDEEELTQLTQSETAETVFARLPFVSIEKINIGGVQKVKVVVHARFADGRRVPIRDDILDIIKRRLALYQISVGLMGRRAFYIEHGSIDQNPARAITRYPLSFDLVQNRVQVMTLVGPRTINSLPDQTAQYHLDSSNLSSIDIDSPFRLTAARGELTYILRGQSCQHFVGLIPVCFGRIVTSSAEKTGEHVQIHQSFLSKIIDAGSL